MGSRDYNFIYQFDGDLTDDTAKTSWTIDSGSPSYVAGDNGQALVSNSASLSMSMDNELFENGRMIHFVFNVRFNTGYTNGVIFQIETGTKPMWQLNAGGGNALEWVSYNPNGSSFSRTTETMTLDTWLCFGANAWTSTSYRELEPGTAGLNYSNSHTAWLDTEMGADTKLLIGQVGNAASHTGASTTVATGVDIDFMVFDNTNEDFFYSQPLDFGFDPRVAPTFPASVIKEAYPSLEYSTDVDPFVNLSTGTLKQAVASGGGGGPVIKEFWS